MQYLWHQFSHHFERPLNNPVLIFSVILLIILLSPLLLRKIRVPSIIGLIISGVIIGPNALNVLAKSSAVTLFSTIGLLYIMFIAGLELDMHEFRKNRYRGLLFGFLTFIFPLGLGFAVCYYLFRYDARASLLVASVLAPHTLVAYGTLTKFNVARNPAVAVAVSGTIFADTAVLIMLNIIVGSLHGGLDSAFWLRLFVSLVIFVTILFFVIPRIARWFFTEVEDEKTSHYIFVLTVVFFSAFLAESAGLEPIIGAFMAGLAINRLIPHSSVLMNRIEFIGHALFIPFFLISVGMLVDPRVLISGPTALMVAGMLTVAATGGKFIAAWITQLLLGYTKPQRKLIFGLSIGHAAATLAIILIGFRAGLVDENVLNGIVIVILVTCIHASFVTESAARSLVVENSAEIPSEVAQATTENILVASVNPAQTEKLLELAILLKDKKVGGAITALSVVVNQTDAEQRLKKARENLASGIRAAAGSDHKISARATIDLNAADGIARTAKELFSNMIILGWSRRIGFFDNFVASKTDSLLRVTNKLVLVCQFEKPLATHDRLLLVCPPLIEMDHGFGVWLRKIVKLAQELSLPVVALCEGKTQFSLERFWKTTKTSVHLTCESFNDWDNIRAITQSFKRNDLIVFVSARKGTVAYYSSTLEAFPQKAGRELEGISRIVLHPQRTDTGSIYDEYDDINPDAISKSVRAMRRWGRSMRRVLRPRKSGGSKSGPLL
jgi:Kef-type K+ transport system membrane component KefB